MADRILIVEDDTKLAKLVGEYLEREGFEVRIEERGDRAVDRICEEQPQLVILDLMLPGLDGLEVCKRVRPRYEGPILMLTARGEAVDEIVGLEIGADDYLAKPAQPRVLLARIRSLLRRAGRVGASPQRVALGKLVVDAGTRSAALAGRQLELTTAEFDLLWLLARNAGQVLSRDAIYAELRGIAYDGLDRSIDLRVARLRKKLGDDGRQPRLIKSVRGAGYLLVADGA